MEITGKSVGYQNERTDQYAMFTLPDRGILEVELYNDINKKPGLF